MTREEEDTEIWGRCTMCGTRVPGDEKFKKLYGQLPTLCGKWDCVMAWAPVPVPSLDWGME